MKYVAAFNAVTFTILASTTHSGGSGFFVCWLLASVFFCAAISPKQSQKQP
jgi:hypothetical protein